MRRGSIHWINLGKSHPPESGKTRPGLVISNSVQNEILDSVVVVPLSTMAGEIWPLRIELAQATHRTSYAVLPGVRQVSKSRIMDLISTAPPEFMLRIDRALRLYLSD